MIKTYNLVPEVYYKRSRDFQMLGRIYDVIFNYMKMNTNLINNVPYEQNIDDKLISLVTTTLGFKEMHEYNAKQLKGLCSIFADCLRNKGSLSSIRQLLNLLLNVEDEEDEADVRRDLDNPWLLNIYIPQTISDTSLFEDMLLYILPACMSYRIIKEERINKEATDVVYFESQLVGANSKIAVSAQTGKVLAISQLYNIEGQTVPAYLDTSTDVERGRIEDMSIPVNFSQSAMEEEPVEKIYPKEEGE